MTLSDSLQLIQDTIDSKILKIRLSRLLQANSYVYVESITFMIHVQAFLFNLHVYLSSFTIEWQNADCFQIKIPQLLTFTPFICINKLQDQFL